MYPRLFIFYLQSCSDSLSQLTMSNRKHMFCSSLLTKHYKQGKCSSNRSLSITQLWKYLLCKTCRHKSSSLQNKDIWNWTSQFFTSCSRHHDLNTSWCIRPSYAQREFKISTVTAAKGPGAVFSFHHTITKWIFDLDSCSDFLFFARAWGTIHFSCYTQTFYGDFK